MTSLSELMAWEKELKEAINKIDLLYKLEFGDVEFKKLNELLKDFINQERISKDIRFLHRKCPCCLATYLVFCGIYRYKEGDYWSGVEENLGKKLTLDKKLELGQQFKEFLDQRNNLLSFSEEIEEENALPYVTAILLHGGIPNYCLRDFFQNFLDFATLKDDWKGLETKEIIARWFSTSKPIVTKPVIRFLKYGSKFDQAFIAECLRMARAFKEKGSLPRKLKLPLRITAKYQEWAPKKPSKKRHYSPYSPYSPVQITAKYQEWAPKKPSKKRHYSPFIQLDPYGNILTLTLPAQTFFSKVDECRWFITIDRNETEEIIVAVKQQGKKWVTEKRQIEIEFFTEMKVKFVEDGKSTQDFFDLKDRRPLLVFNPTNGHLSPRWDNLPACSVWLLYSQEEKLTVFGGKKQEDFQRLPGTWYSYRVEGWDLSQATEVRLGEKTIPVRREPSLVGNPSDLKVSQEQLTLYIGSPPKVRIPSEEGIPFMQNDWHVTFRDKDEETIFAEPLKNLCDAIQRDNDDYLLDLYHLLDLQPFGIFEVRLKDKQGHVFSLKFAVIPKLSLTGHKRVRVPDETGEMPEFRLEVVLDSKFSLECADEEVCLAKKENGLYEIIAPARFEELELNLSLDSNSQISLDLPLPTLHWAFVESQSAIASPSANYKQLYQQWDVWYNSPSCYLKVWIAPVMQPISGRIQVHWDNNNYPQTLENCNNRKRELVFNLKGAAESVQHSCFTKIPFELRIYELSGHTESFSRKVLILKRSVREIINNLFIGYQRLINRQEHNKFLSILKKMKDSIVLSKEDRSEFEKISQKISPYLLSFLKRECPKLFGH